MLTPRHSKSFVQVGRVSSGSYCASAIVGCVDCETFSGRNQSTACALAWVIIARDSESEHPFYPVGQFRRICAGY